MKARRDKIYGFWMFLNSPIQQGGCSNAKGSVEFVKWVLLNKKAIKSIVEEVDKFNAEHQSNSQTEIIEYDKKRGKISEKYADRDSDGKLVITYKENDHFLKFSDDEKKTKADEELKALNEEYKNVLEEWEETQEKIKNFYEEEIDVDLNPINIEELTNTQMSPKQAEIMQEMGLIII